MKLLSFVLLAGLISVAHASDGLEAFDAHCADLATLQLKSVQKELGVTKAQRDRMNVFADKHAAELEALRKRTAGAKTDTSRELYGYYSELKVAVLKQLTAAQVRRLREISLQRIGLLALCDPVVGKKVGLSDAQMKRLRAVYDEGFAKFKEIEQAAASKILAPYKDRQAKTKAEAEALNAEVQGKLKAARTTIEPKLAVIKEEYDHKMRAVLTPAQSKAYEELRGKPFNP